MKKHPKIYAIVGIGHYGTGRYGTGLYCAERRYSTHRREYITANLVEFYMFLWNSKSQIKFALMEAAQSIIHYPSFA